MNQIQLNPILTVLLSVSLFSIITAYASVEVYEIEIHCPVTSFDFAGELHEFPNIIICEFNFAQPNDPLGWTDDIDINSLKKSTDNFGWIDTIAVKHNTIIQQSPSSGGGSPTHIVPDSDKDGILDPEDNCISQPENINSYQDSDGCPDVIPQIIDQSISPPSILELSIIDDNVILQKSLTHPQLEELTIRWFANEQLKITNIQIGDSPFDVQINNIPSVVTTNKFSLTDTNIPYTIQAPDKLCNDEFNFDCLASVTYDIPVIVTGELDGNVFQSEGRIRIDNSERINPYLILIIILFIIIISAFLIFFKKIKKKQSITRNTYGKNQVSIRMIKINKDKRKEGTTLQTLAGSSIKNIINASVNKNNKPDRIIIPKLKSIEKHKIEKPKNDKKSRFKFSFKKTKNKRRNVFGK